MTITQDEQSHLLQAITAFVDPSDFDPRGLAVYQRNLQANACRALAISFPTVHEYLGEQHFNRLATAYLVYDLPTVGDWGEWGCNFSAWLASHQSPMVSECAHLDWAKHQLERAENPALAFDTFHAMAHPNAGAGYIQLNTALSIITCEISAIKRWMAKSISVEPASHNNHQSVLLWRKGWKVQARMLSKTEKYWLGLLQSKTALKQALEQIEDFVAPLQHAEFSFEQWLPMAIEDHLVKGFIGP